MEIRYGANPQDTMHYTTEELRDEFLIDSLFASGEIRLVYSHIDRMITGSAVPSKGALSLLPGEELRSEYFLERREMGIILIAGSGWVKTEAATYRMEKGDGLYLGRGTREVTFGSDSGDAHFYFNSAPAHAVFPSAQISIKDATPVKAGKAEDCNERTIYKYFHPDGVKTCQLVMGMTLLASGSVWNTWPCHTHERRMEVYLYFDVKGPVFHFMGQPNETRHIIVGEKQAVISPSWSIHSGVGTGSYTFIWGMAGENQTFTDMDAVNPQAIR